MLRYLVIVVTLVSTMCGSRAFALTEFFDFNFTVTAIEANGSARFAAAEPATKGNLYFDWFILKDMENAIENSIRAQLPLTMIGDETKVVMELDETKAQLTLNLPGGGSFVDPLLNQEVSDLLFLSPASALADLDHGLTAADVQTLNSLGCTVAAPNLGRSYVAIDCTKAGLLLVSTLPWVDSLELAATPGSPLPQ